jgi:prephenate dehydrogenase
MATKRLGFIGIGLMGEAMTRRLFDKGYEVTVWNLEPERHRADGTVKLSEKDPSILGVCLDQAALAIPVTSVQT